MSAYIVSHDHIDAILTAYRHFVNSYDCPNVGEATIIGRDLLHENSKSVAYRYNEEVDNGWADYNFEPVKNDLTVLSPVQLIKLCDCLDHQSCEHPEWDESPAKATLTKIRETAINALSGMEDAVWEYTRKVKA